MNNHDDLLAQAKARLPLPALMAVLGYGEHAKKSARCMFHADSHKSFSAYQRGDGSWAWKCHAGCGGGDEPDFLAKYRGLSNADAASTSALPASYPRRVPARLQPFNLLLTGPPASPHSSYPFQSPIPPSPLFCIVNVRRAENSARTVPRELDRLAAAPCAFGSSPWRYALA